MATGEGPAAISRGVTVAIETSGKAGGVAVGRGLLLLAARDFEPGLLHGREVVPRLRALFDELALSPSAIEAIVVDVGPGSYTGLRVGIAAAKALAFATGAACAGISAFACFAAAATIAEGERLFTTRDARRGQVYGALFARRDGALVRELPDFAATPLEAAARVPEGAIVVGDGADAYPAILGPPRYRRGPDAWAAPSVATLYAVGAAALARGESTAAEALVPLYLQPSEPERRARDRG